MQSHTEDTTFVKARPDEIKVHNRTYENCRFVACDFSNNYLDGLIFVDCKFEDCNLHLTGLSNTALQNVTFKQCKLSGANFSKCRDFLFEVHFDNCILDNAIFYQKKIKRAVFSDCSMIETDLTDVDATEAKFINCNLNRAFFGNTILKGADLRSSYNFTINPDENILKKTMFSVHGLPGLLSKYDLKIEG